MKKGSRERTYLLGETYVYDYGYTYLEVEGHFQA